jgi:hypothetical protein
VIDLYASQSHYLAHLQPVWDALDDSDRGEMYLGSALASRADHLPNGALRRPGPRVLVASYSDYLRCAGNRRVVLVSHGAGQSYAGDPSLSRNGSYAGGDGLDAVDLFLVPGPHPAQRTRARYPHTPVVEVGCPALDRWLTGGRPWEREPGPVVVIAFHWNCGGGEAGTAFRHYVPALNLLTRTGWEVLGHCHPRARNYVEPEYRRAGIRWASYEEVMSRASVIVVDNSSIGFEVAATGRPVVWLNAPWWRRNPGHGLRFGPEAGVGIEVDSPDKVVGVVSAALAAGRWPFADPRWDLVRKVYTHVDGTSAQRAAEAIRSLAPLPSEPAMSV